MLIQHADVYRWILKWMSQKSVKRLSSKLSVVVESKLSRTAIWKKMSGGDSNADDVVSKSPPKILYTPGPGLRILCFFSSS